MKRAWKVREIFDPQIRNPRFESNEEAWAAGMAALLEIIRPILDEMLEIDECKSDSAVSAPQGKDGSSYSETDTE